MFPYVAVFISQSDGFQYIRLARRITIHNFEFLFYLLSIACTICIQSDFNLNWGSPNGGRCVNMLDNFVLSIVSWWDIYEQMPLMYVGASPCFALPIRAWLGNYITVWWIGP
jgi:hypothetical protein